MNSIAEHGIDDISKFIDYLQSKIYEKSATFSVETAIEEFQSLKKDFAISKNIQKQINYWHQHFQKKLQVKNLKEII